MIAFSIDDYPAGSQQTIGDSGYVDLAPVTIGTRQVELTVWSDNELTQGHLDAFARFLQNYGKFEPAFAAAIKADYERDKNLAEWMEEVLEPPYWQALFPGCQTAEDVTAEHFFKATTLCSISFYPDRPDDGTEITADYRFCVPESALVREHPHGLRFADRVDVTDQILAIRAMLDGKLVSVGHES